MSHFEQERTCAACGQTFRLSDHAVVGARAVAEALDAGALADQDAPDVARACPKCLGNERMDAEAANAELFRLEHATKQARERQIPRDVKTWASGLAFMGTALLIGSFLGGVFRGHNILTWTGTAAGGMVAFAGIMVGVVAVARVYGKRKGQL